MWKVLWPSLMAVLATVATDLAPTIQHEIATHPKLSAAVSLVAWLVAHWRPSPLQRQ